MNIIVVDGREALQCPHCEGTGTCHWSSAVYFEDNKDNLYVVRECNRCGRGISQLRGIFTTTPLPPVCAVCSGTGYNRVG